MSYAIIDHIGYVEKNMYPIVSAHAAKLGYTKKNKTLFNIREVCKAKNPYYDNLNKDKQNKIKWMIRQTTKLKTPPDVVYLICEHLETAVIKTDSGTTYRAFSDNTDSQVNFVKEMWESHGVPVMVASAQEGITPPDEFSLYDFGRDIKFSKARRCAIIWSKAFGQTFSAPLYREYRNVDNDNYFKRHDRKEMQEKLGNHITKITTNPEKYNNALNKIATEKECEKFFEYYKLLYNARLIETSLEPGWKLCPNCGRPYYAEASGEYRFGNMYVECEWCPTLNPVDVQLEQYFEDRYEDEDDWD